MVSSDKRPLYVIARDLKGLEMIDGRRRQRADRGTAAWGAGDNLTLGRQTQSEIRYANRV